MKPALFSQMRRSLSDRLITALLGIFQSFDSWRTPEANQFVAQAVPMVQGAQRTLAALTSLYIADQAAEALGRTLAPPPVPDLAAVDLRKGITTSEVYQRPFTTVRVALAKGIPPDESVARGAHRLGQIAEADLQQTHAEAARAAMQALPADAQPSGWRRALVGPTNCALCVAASTQRYTVANLNPIHPNCNCRIEPLFGDQPHVIEPTRLEQVKAAITEITDPGNRDIRGLIVEHGELGPMLARPRDHFTTPNELPS